MHAKLNKKNKTPEMIIICSHNKFISEVTTDKIDQNCFSTVVSYVFVNIM